MIETFKPGIEKVAGVNDLFGLSANAAPGLMNRRHFQLTATGGLAPTRETNPGGVWTRLRE